MTKTVRKTAPESGAVTAKVETKQVQLAEKFCLKHHKDEVWDVCFSNDGTKLASSGADKTTIIYQVDDDFKVLHILSGHSGGIGSSSWSPDDTKLVTCCQDNTARMWDTAVSSSFPRISSGLIL
jgi:WD40 repeat protein